MKRNKSIEVLREKAFVFAKELKLYFPEIIGISISGSAAGDFADEYSDIDLDLWLSDVSHKKWLKNCPLIKKYCNCQIKKETPSNYTLIKDKDKFDLNLLSLEKTIDAKWGVEQKSRRQSSIIVYDRNCLIKNILKEKTNFVSESNFDNKEFDNRLSENFYVFYISAYINYFVPIAIKRRQFEQAHIDIDFAMNMLLDYVCIKNSVFFPHTKAKWQYASRYLNSNILARLREAKLIKSYSTREINRRRKLLKTILSDLKIEETNFTNPNL